MDRKEAETKRMSKEEIIDTLKGLVFGTFDRTTGKEREALDMAIEALKAQEWIPCSDRLPNKGGSFLITSEIGAVTTAHWYMPSEWGPDGFWGRKGKKKTVAWMPLPEPYKEGE